MGRGAGAFLGEWAGGWVELAPFFGLGDGNGAALTDGAGEGAPEGVADEDGGDATGADTGASTGEVPLAFVGGAATALGGVATLG